MGTCDNATTLEWAWSCPGTVKVHLVLFSSTLGVFYIYIYICFVWPEKRMNL